MIKLKNLLNEAKQPDYQLTLPLPKCPTRKLIDIFKSKNASFVSPMKKKELDPMECREVTHKLNESVNKVTPYKMYFAICDSNEWKSSEDDGPFSYGEMISRDDAYYNREPHIVFYLNSVFFKWLKDKNYDKLYNAFNGTLNHEIVHIHQFENKENQDLIDFFETFDMRDFMKIMDEGGSSLFKTLRTNPNKVDKKKRGIIAKKYLLNPAEVPAYAYSCVVGMCGKLHETEDLTAEECRNEVRSMINNADKHKKKCKTLELFNGFIQSENKAKYNKFISLCNDYLNELDISYFDKY